MTLETSLATPQTTLHETGKKTPGTLTGSSSLSGFADLFGQAKAAVGKTDSPINVTSSSTKELTSQSSPSTSDTDRTTDPRKYKSSTTSNSSDAAVAGSQLWVLTSVVSMPQEPVERKSIGEHAEASTETAANKTSDKLLLAGVKTQTQTTPKTTLPTAMSATGEERSADSTLSVPYSAIRTTAMSSSLEASGKSEKMPIPTTSENKDLDTVGKATGKTTLSSTSTALPGKSNLGETAKSTPTEASTANMGTPLPEGFVRVPETRLMSSINTTDSGAKATTTPRTETPVITEPKTSAPVTTHKSTAPATEKTANSMSTASPEAIIRTPEMPARTLATDKSTDSGLKTTTTPKIENSVTTEPQTLTPATANQPVSVPATGQSATSTPTISIPLPSFAPSTFSLSDISGRRNESGEATSPRLAEANSSSSEAKLERTDGTKPAAASTTVTSPATRSTVISSAPVTLSSTPNSTVIPTSSPVASGADTSRFSMSDSGHEEPREEESSMNTESQSQPKSSEKRTETILKKAETLSSTVSSNISLSTTTTKDDGSATQKTNPTVATPAPVTGSTPTTIPSGAVATPSYFTRYSDLSQQFAEQVRDRIVRLDSGDSLRSLRFEMTAEAVGKLEVQVEQHANDLKVTVVMDDPSKAALLPSSDVKSALEALGYASVSLEYQFDHRERERAPRRKTSRYINSSTNRSSVARETTAANQVTSRQYGYNTIEYLA